MATRLVIIGGGPAGHTAASHAARLGAEVTLVERDIIGGAAHLWDCIPSKAMIATGGALAAVARSPEMGLAEVATTVDVEAQHPEPSIGEGQGQRQADVAQPDDADQRLLRFDRPLQTLRVLDHRPSSR